MADDASYQHRERRLATLEHLLALPATTLAEAMRQAAQLVADAFGADKVNALLDDPAVDTLVALGTSDTPMGRRERALGLDRMPLSNGGHAAQVFRTGMPHRCGHVDRDPEELPGLVHGLGIRSEILALWTSAASGASCCWPRPPRRSSSRRPT